MNALLGGVALVLAASSCAVTVDSPSPTAAAPTSTAAPATTTTTLSAEAALAAFEACLEEGGLGIEPIPLDAAGRPRFDLVMPEVDFGDETQVEALSECSALLSAGAIALEVDDDLHSLVMGSLMDFAECVRAHGVEGFPDPQADFAGVGAPFPPEAIPFDHPGLEDATRLCVERMGEP